MNDDNQLPSRVFNYLLLRTIIGGIALSLPFVVWYLANQAYPSIEIPTSISVTYHLGARDVFVGSLCVVSAFLFAYNGYYNKEHPRSQYHQSLLSKVAGLCAAVLALSPMSCNNAWILEITEQAINTCLQKPLLGFIPLGFLHTIAAIILFIILAIFCLYYFQFGAEEQEGKKKATRKIIYKFCGWIMVTAMLVGAYDLVSDFFGLYEKGHVSKIMFGVELVCLVAFGFAWIVAGKQLPFLATSRERQGFD
ncbi:MAG: hypothetical protein AAGG51_09475 [Cyanobacteria bacterium P01_G01_bin.54]